MKLPNGAINVKAYNGDASDYALAIPLSDKAKWVVEQLDGLISVNVFKGKKRYWLQEGTVLRPFNSLGALDAYLNVRFCKEIASRMKADAELLSKTWIAGVTVLKDADTTFNPGVPGPDGNMGVSPCDLGALVLLQCKAEFDPKNLTVAPECEYLVTDFCDLENAASWDGETLLAKNGMPVTINDDGGLYVFKILSRIPAGTSEASLFSGEIHVPLLGSERRRALQCAASMPTLCISDYYTPGDTLSTTNYERAYSLLSPLDQAFIRIPDDSLRYGLHCAICDPVVDEILDSVARFDMDEQWKYD